MLIPLAMVIVVLIPWGILFYFTIRWSRITELPACPKCRQCLRGTAGEVCPECGNNLATTGVVNSKWRVKTRRQRLTTVLTFAISGFVVLFFLAASRVAPTRIYHGKWTVSIPFSQGPIKEIEFVYPGWLDPSLDRDMTGRATWTYPQHFPLRLEMTSEDGTHHAVLIDPQGTEFDLRAMPSSGARTGPVLSTTGSSSLQQLLGKWMVENGLSTSARSPEARMVDQVVVLMTNAIPPGDPFIGVWYRLPAMPVGLEQGVPNAMGPNTTSNAGGGFKSDPGRALLLLLPPWIIAWIIIGLFVLIPNPGTEDWKTDESPTSE